MFSIKRKISSINLNLTNEIAHQKSFSTALWKRNGTSEAVEASTAFPQLFHSVTVYWSLQVGVLVQKVLVWHPSG